MATHDGLQDEINVSVNVEKAKFPKSAYPNLFNRVEKIINWKLSRAKSELAPTVGIELAKLNQKSQKAGISYLNAIRTGRLFDSITIKGGNGSQVVHYRVGTNLRQYYPQWVVFGRSPATARAGHFLRFQPKGSDEYIFRKSVKKAEPRNYPAVAHTLFDPNISAIVEREVNRVLRN